MMNSITEIIQLILIVAIIIYIVLRLMGKLEKKDK